MQAFAIAAAGIAGATERFAAGAARTAADPLADPAGEAVGRMTSETTFKANVAVLKTADEMYGSLLDILA